MPLAKSINNLDLSTFGGRLYEQAIMISGSLNSFSKQYNIGLDSLQDYVSNKTIPKMDKLISLVNAGMDLNYLMFGKIEKNNPFILAENDFIPKFTSPVRGGTWNMIDNDNHSNEIVPKWLVKGIKKPAMVDVIGSSMAPTITFKDTVIFDMQREVKDKDIVICTYDSDTMIKTYRNRNNIITLESTNPKFEPIIVKAELVIHGVVIKVIHNTTKKRSAF